LGFVSDDTVSIDPTHIEAREKAPAKDKRQKLKQKQKHGRKPKEERT